MLRSAAVLIISVMLGACVRPVEVGTADARLSYSVQVTNETGVDMIVRYNDGRADALLGSVAAGTSERFIIAAPATTSVTITGTATTGDRRSGPHRVQLGERTQIVLLR